MSLAGSPIQQARKAGYSDEEIVTFFMKHPKYEKGTKKAVEAGYSPEEIIKFVEEKENPYPHGVASLVQKHPVESAASVISGPLGMAEYAARAAGKSFAEPIQGLMNINKGRQESTGHQLSPEELTELAFQDSPSKIFQDEGIGTPITEKLREAAGINELPEKAHEELMLLDLLAPTLAKGAGKVYKYAKNIPKTSVRIFPKKPSIPPSSGPSGPSGPSFRESLKNTIEDFKESFLGKPRNLQSQVKNLPMTESVGEVAEEALEAIQRPKIKQLQEKSKFLPSQKPLNEAPSLKGRVSIEETPGKAISKEKFSSEYQGGKAVEDYVKKNAFEERKLVSELYKKSEKEAEGISGLFPKSTRMAEEILENMKTFTPNTGEQAVVKALESLLKNTGSTSEGLIQAPVSSIIKTADSISGTAKYEMPFNGPKDILKKIVKQLNEEAKEVLKSSGKNAKALEKADKAYGQFADLYLNDKVESLLAKNFKDQEKLLNIIISDPGSRRAVGDILRKKPNGRKILNAIDRNLSDQFMKDFIKNPELIGNQNYKEKIRSISDIIGKEKASALDKSMKQFQKRRSIAPSKEAIPKKASGTSSLSKEAERVSKVLKESRESIESKMNSVSGIRGLRKDLSEIGEKDLFDRIAEAKAQEIFRAGKVESMQVTATDLNNVVNDRKKFELLKEIYGEKAAETLRVASKEGAAIESAAKTAQQQSEARKKVLVTSGKIAASSIGAGKLFSLLRSILASV